MGNARKLFSVSLTSSRTDDVDELKIILMLLTSATLR